MKENLCSLVPYDILTSEHILLDVSNVAQIPVVHG